MMSSVYINSARQLEGMLSGLLPSTAGREAAIHACVRDFIVITRHMREAEKQAGNDRFSMHFMDEDSFAARAKQRGNPISSTKGWMLFENELLIRRAEGSTTTFTTDDGLLAAAGLRHSHALHIFLSATRDADKDARHLAVQHTKFIHLAITLNALRLGVDTITAHKTPDHGGLLLASALDRFIEKSITTGTFDARIIAAMHDDMLFRAGDYLLAPISPLSNANPSPTTLATQIEELIVLRNNFASPEALYLKICESEKRNDFKSPEEALRFFLRQHGEKMAPLGRTYWEQVAALPKASLDLELLALNFLLEAYKDMKWKAYNGSVLGRHERRNIPPTTAAPLALPPPEGGSAAQPAFGTLRMYEGSGQSTHAAPASARKPARPAPILKLVRPEPTPEDGQ